MLTIVRHCLLTFSILLEAPNDPQVFCLCLSPQAWALGRIGAALLSENKMGVVFFPLTQTYSSESGLKYYSSVGWSEILVRRPMGLAGNLKFMSVWLPKQQG